MTTAQMEADALTVPCPEHHASEGTECRKVAMDGEERESAVCLTRQSLASARREIAAFPGPDEIEVLNWRQMRELAERMRDAANDASSCVDVALRPFGLA